jgi:tRNA A37 methylthiotransferase MiaB
MPARSIHFVSLGCPKNRVDTEVLLGVAGRTGYRTTDDAAQAEVIVVNTCGFIGEAKKESIQTIFELAEIKKHGACKKLVVTGCLSQTLPGGAPDNTDGAADERASGDGTAAEAAVGAEAGVEAGGHAPSPPAQSRVALPPRVP